MSANLTSAPQYLIQLAVAANGMGEVITLSPFFNPNARTERCNPAVALFTATEYFAPTY